MSRVLKWSTLFTGVLPVVLWAGLALAETQATVLEQMEKNKIPATDILEAEKQAKEISGRDDPFKSLILEDMAQEGFRALPGRSETEGLSLTGVFINGGVSTAIIQRGTKSYYVDAGMTVENLKVVAVHESWIDLISKTGKRYTLKMGGSL